MLWWINHFDGKTLVSKKDVILMVNVLVCFREHWSWIGVKKRVKKEKYLLEGFALSYYCQGFVWWRIICYTFLFETEKKANCHCFRLWQFVLTFLQTVSFHLYLLLLYFRNTPDSCPQTKAKNQIFTNCISNCVPPFQTNVLNLKFKKLKQIEIIGIFAKWNRRYNR